MRINHNSSEGNSSGLLIKDLLPKKPKLFIASLSYDGKFNAQFVASLTRTLKLFWSKQIEIDIYYCNNDPFIDRARNTLVEKFLETDCTHFLTIDADEGWEAEKVLKMIEFDEDIISGAVPIKDPNGENYALKIHTNFDGTPIVDEKGLINCQLVGAAFLMVKRRVFDAIRKLNPSDTCYSISPFYYSYFKTEIINGIFWGEDMTFCRKCNEAGFKIKIYPDINFDHCGQKVWKGNYHNYLMNQPKPEPMEFFKV